MDDEGGFYMPLHGWALFFILMVDKDRVKKLITRLPVLKKAVLKMLTHVLGPDVIPYLLNAVFSKGQ